MKPHWSSAIVPHAARETWKNTILAGLANYIDAGSIVAGSVALALWAETYHLSPRFLGLIGAFSANAIAAGVGALVGGWLCDRYGRKKIYQYDMLFLCLWYVVARLRVPTLDVPHIASARRRTNHLPQNSTTPVSVSSFLSCTSRSACGKPQMRSIFCTAFCVVLRAWAAPRCVAVPHPLSTRLHASIHAVVGDITHGLCCLRSILPRSITKRAMAPT
jgi:MFS family permease